MNNCINKIINNDYYIKNNIYNGPKKIYNKTYYSKGKKNLYDTKIKIQMSKR